MCHCLPWHDSPLWTPQLITHQNLELSSWILHFCRSPAFVEPHLGGSSPLDHVRWPPPISAWDQDQLGISFSWGSTSMWELLQGFVECFGHLPMPCFFPERDMMINKKQHTCGRTWLLISSQRCSELGRDDTSSIPHVLIWIYVYCIYIYSEHSNTLWCCCPLFQRQVWSFRGRFGVWEIWKWKRQFSTNSQYSIYIYI